MYLTSAAGRVLVPFSPRPDSSLPLPRLARTPWLLMFFPFSPSPCFFLGGWVALSFWMGAQSRVLARVRPPAPLGAQLRRGDQVLPQRPQARAGKPADPQGSRSTPDSDPGGQGERKKNRRCTYSYTVAVDKNASNSKAFLSSIRRHIVFERRSGFIGTRTEMRYCSDGLVGLPVALRT